MNEFFPTLKYRPVGAPIRIRESDDDAEEQQTGTRGSRTPSDGLRTCEKPATTSALKAGWVCFGIGLAIAWIFPPAYFFYSIGLTMAVVAMATHQVSKGLALLVTCFAGMAASAVISMLLAVGLFAAAAGSVTAKLEKDREAMQRAQQKQQQRLVTTAVTAQRRAPALSGQSSSALSSATPRPALTVRWQQAQHQQSAQPMTPSSAAPASVPVQEFNQRQLLDEIARVEKQQRDLRRAGRDLPASSQVYLEQLRVALDKAF